MKSKHSKRGFERHRRVADLIQKTLARMLLDENDPRLRLVTITSVTVTRDFSHAKIYVSVLMDDKEEIRHTIHALNRIAKSLRYQLAQEVKMRVIPELKFVYDESIAHGFKISMLIDSTVKKEK